MPSSAGHASSNKTTVRDKGDQRTMSGRSFVGQILYWWENDWVVLKINQHFPIVGIIKKTPSGRCFGKPSHLTFPNKLAWKSFRATSAKITRLRLLKTGSSSSSEFL